MDAKGSGNRETRIARYTNRAIYRDMKERARFMRQQPTQAEAILWKRLRKRQLNGHHFRRQHPIVRFIVDFYCAEAKLVVEVDGSVHGQPGHDEYDAERQEFLEELGLRVLRFSNVEVVTETDEVLNAIVEALN